MTTLRIVHRTIYGYRRPVRLGAHRLMLRPRESRDLKLIRNDLVISPLATITWAHDVYGNAVATATFGDRTASLTIECTTELELYAVDWPVFDIAASAISFPFRYSDDEWKDLGQLTVCQHDDPHGQLARWAQV